MSNTSFRLRVSGIVEESVADGPGFRLVIFAQGCPHDCPGCHNPQTHSFEGGYFPAKQELLDAIAENPLLAGATFSGGEPFCQAAAFADLARGIHALGKNIVTYSGYTIERLEEMAAEDAGVAELLDETDILIDGPFVQAQRDLSLRFRGSANQRIIDMNARRAKRRGWGNGRQIKNGL